MRQPTWSEAFLMSCEFCLKLGLCVLALKIMVYLIWDGESMGSANMLEIMQNLGKPVHQVILK